MKKTIALILLGCSLVVADAEVKDLSTIEKVHSSRETLFEAAKGGDAASMMLLGQIYLDGISVKADHQKAFFWLSKAANIGDTEAQYLLGFMYDNGIYVEQNPIRAVKWYTEAALKGDVLSQYNLAFIYKEGRGEIKKDIQEAYKWLCMIEEIKKKNDFVAIR